MTHNAVLLQLGNNSGYSKPFFIIYFQRRKRLCFREHNVKCDRTINKSSEIISTVALLWALFIAADYPCLS
jgi:hypothetical protein